MFRSDQNHLSPFALKFVKMRQPMKHGIWSQQISYTSYNQTTLPQTYDAQCVICTGNPSLASPKGRRGHPQVRQREEDRGERRHL